MTPQNRTQAIATFLRSTVTNPKEVTETRAENIHRELLAKASENLTTYEHEFARFRSYVTSIVTLMGKGEAEFQDAQ